MSSAIVPFEPQNLAEGMALAEQMSKSALLPEALRGKTADILIILMTARELGIGPMQALRGMSVIKGKVVMEAALAVAQVVRKRDICEYFRMVESTDTKASYVTKRVGSEEVPLTFTIEQAKAAGLTGKENWRTFPAAMLRARCSMHLARAVYPDLLLGIYDPDELGAPPVSVPPPAEPIKTLTRTDEVKAKLKEAVGFVEAPKVEAKPSPWETIKEAAGHAGMDVKATGALVREMTGKSKVTELTTDDADKVCAEIGRRLMSQEEPPPPGEPSFEEAAAN